MIATMEDSRRKNLKSQTFHFFDPGRLFERIIRAWGAENIHPLSLSPSERADLPIERKVALSGTLRGLLVVRTSPEFLVFLRDLRENTAMARYNPEEIFGELVSLYCLYLFHDFWNPESFRIGPIQPVLSTPNQWPSHAPQAACGMEVDGHPLEIRLWLED